MKHLLFSTLILLLAISCNKENEANLSENTISTNDLLGCWNHDVEAQTTDQSTSYLMTKCDAKEFPSTWFRYSLIFEENNKGSELLLAENDAHSYHEMTWGLSDQSLTIDGLFQKAEYTVEVINEESILLTQK